MAVGMPIRASLAALLLLLPLSLAAGESPANAPTLRLARASPVATVDAARALGYLAGGGAYCSLSVVADSWVLFAAHCNVTAETTVRIGAHDSVPGTSHKIVKLHPHEQFASTPFRAVHDIAVAQISPPVPGAALRLNSRADTPANNTVVRGLGYGETESGGGAFVLRKARFVALSAAACVAEIRAAGLPNTADGIDKDAHLCANERRVGAGVCRGDSGGPLVISEPGKRFVQVGVSSYILGGQRCGNVVKPDVYTRVSTYVPWILKNIGNAPGLQPLA